jgi:hypothetical protein
VPPLPVNYDLVLAFRQQAFGVQVVDDHVHVGIEVAFPEHGEPVVSLPLVLRVELLFWVASQPRLEANTHFLTIDLLRDGVILIVLTISWDGEVENAALLAVVLLLEGVRAAVRGLNKAIPVVDVDALDGVDL